MNYTHQHKELNADSIKRAVFGVLPNLDALFSEFAFVPTSTEATPRAGCRRRFHRWPEGTYYLNAENVPTIDCTFETFVKRGLAIAARPTPDALKQALPMCSENRLGSFAIVAWPHTGHALVMAKDALHIANVWLAFVPIDALPTINPNNTQTV